MFFEQLYSSAVMAFAGLVAGGRFPHALLLEGADGIGKQTLAQNFAAAYLCQNKTGPFGCGQCVSCKKAAHQNHPDIIVSRPGGGSKGFHLEYVRGIKSDAQIKPNESEYKIYILCDVHTMPPGSQNAVLKLIEEPPPHVLFILTTQNSGLLLGTVLSRVQKITVEPAQTAQIAQAMKALYPDKAENELDELAELSGGIIGKAILMAKKNDTPARQNVQALLGAAKNKNAYDVLVIISKYEKNRDSFLEFLNDFKALAYKISVNTGMPENTPKLTALQAVKIIDIIDTAVLSVLQNGNMALVTTNFTNAFLKILKN